MGPINRSDFCILNSFSEFPNQKLGQRTGLSPTEICGPPPEVKKPKRIFSFEFRLKFPESMVQWKAPFEQKLSFERYRQEPLLVPIFLFPKWKGGKVLVFPFILHVWRWQGLILGRNADASSSPTQGSFIAFSARKRNYLLGLGQSW